jgi:hypothetical protein
MQFQYVNYSVTKLTVIRSHTFDNACYECQEIYLTNTYNKPTLSQNIYFIDVPTNVIVTIAGVHKHKAPGVTGMELYMLHYRNSVLVLISVNRTESRIVLSLINKTALQVLHVRQRGKASNRHTHTSK